MLPDDAAQTRCRCFCTPQANTRATVRPRSLDPVRPDELERQLRERLDALGPAPRAELVHVLMLPTSSGP
jgi:hypothetical protein